MEPGKEGWFTENSGLEALKSLIFRGFWLKMVFRISDVYPPVYDGLGRRRLQMSETEETLLEQG